MRFFSRILPIIAMAAIAGCVTVILLPSADPAHVFITPSGIVHLGETVPMEKIPARLHSADVEKTHEIRIHFDEANRDQQIMSRLTGVLRQAGFTHVIFMAERRASSQVIKEPGTPSNAFIRVDETQP